MRLIRSILRLISWLIMIPIVLIFVYLLSANFNFWGGYQSFVVQSGSMEPTIMTGDIIVAHSTINNYHLNDVITFHNNSGRIVTHRIIVVNDGRKYSTKGDANRSSDEDFITENQIIGKVVLVVPRLGYVVAFSKTRLGLFILLLIPAFIFILDELLKVKDDKSTH